MNATPQPHPLTAAIAALLNVPVAALAGHDYGALRTAMARAIWAYEHETEPKTEVK